MRKISFLLVCALFAGQVPAAEISLDLVGSLRTSLEMIDNFGDPIYDGPAPTIADPDQLYLDGGPNWGWLFFDTTHLSGSLSSATLRLRIDDVSLPPEGFANDICGQPTAVPDGAPWNDPAVLGPVTCSIASTVNMRIGSIADIGYYSTLPAKTVYDLAVETDIFLEAGKTYNTFELGQDDVGAFIDVALDQELVSIVQSNFGADWSGLSLHSNSSRLSCGYENPDIIGTANSLLVYLV